MKEKNMNRTLALLTAVLLLAANASARSRPPQHHSLGRR
jgi:hypothetical protein